MKRVAFLTDGWKRLVTYAWNIGIKESIDKYDENVMVYQFNSFGNWSGSESFNTGEYNIFNLPEFHRFDGVLIDATNITDEKVLEKIINRILESGVPAVSLGKRIDGLYYVGIDNETTITNMMDHLYDIHNCRSFIFAGGPADNCDNIERRSAYEKFLSRKNMSIEDNPAWSGKYTFDAGELYFDKVMKENIPIPDAFVCANDHIATGIIVKAKEYGYDVPGDFIVTGFDNLDQSKFFKPHLTTVEQKREKIGSAGIEILFDVWQGKEIDKQVLVDNTCVFSQSCGCVKEDTVDYPYYVEQFIAKNSRRIEMEGDLAEYQIALSVAQSYEEVFEAVKKYVLGQNCGDFALLLDKRLLLGYDLEIFPTERYDYDNMIIPIYIESGQPREVSNVMDYQYRMIREDIHGILVYSPIHYEDKTLGVVSIKDGSFLFDDPRYCNMLMYLSQAIIRIYQSNALSSENEKLDHLYKHDQLTGVYNRIAFRMDSESYIRSLHNQGVNCTIAFVDADNFKTINDTYGHDKGDEVLIEIARVLDHYKTNGIVYRYGGDEFIVLYSNATGDFQAYLEKVRAALAEDDISVSIGYITSTVGEEIDIDRYINEADACMYEVKRARKASS